MLFLASLPEGLMLPCLDTGRVLIPASPASSGEGGAKGLVLLFLPLAHAQCVSDFKPQTWAFMSQGIPTPLTFLVQRDSGGE